MAKSTKKEKEGERKSVGNGEHLKICANSRAAALRLPLLVYICLNVPVFEKWRQTCRQTERERVRKLRQ